MPKTLLLADDSRTIHQAVSMTFAGEDVKLITASDGEAALQAAKQSKPDLILADVLMPKLGGYELCQRVRADAALKDVPVLLLGGRAPLDPAKAMAVGANGHMPKPFDSGKLIEPVKIILANPKAKPVIAPAAAQTAKPGAAAGRPTAPSPAARPAVSPGASGSTMVMSRPPMPAGAQSKPPPSNPPRPPSAPAISAPPAAARPPAAKPPVTGPPAARTSASPLSSPGPGRPAAPPAKPPPVASRPPAPPATDDDEIPLDEEVVDDLGSPAPTPLRSVPSSAHKPALSVVPPPADGGEAILREALSRASREVIEKIAWEVVPELAETIIREELERLIKERGS